MKIVTVLGARPQFIKAAAVSRALRNHPGIGEVLVHTGQHFDDSMSRIFFREMEIPEPAYHLDVHSLPHGAMTGRMLEKIEEVIRKERPDATMVYGDTNSTLAGALAAAKIPPGRVVHVEAGLRSHNMSMPEEINRILTDRLSTILFCPTDTAVANLHAEGFEGFPCSIHKPGDVMQDAAMFYGARSAERSTVMRTLGDAPFVLATLHRQENTDDPARLSGILDGLGRIHRRIRVVLPVHPRTRKTMEAGGFATPVMLIDPVGYFDMLELLKHASLVLTDSGGVQKEAYFHALNCVTLRDETEWTELVHGGFNMLAGADADVIEKAFATMIERKNDFSGDLYGGGKASGRIADMLLRHLSTK